MDIVNFTRKLDAVPVIAFFLDIYFSGVATLLLEIYYNYYHFRPGIKTIILDLVFLKTLLEPFVDCYYAGDCPYNRSYTQWYMRVRKAKLKVFKKLLSNVFST